MRISGFTFAKNTSKLYYPIKESIESILPIVDEFIVVLGDCDEDDTTLELIESIQSDKIKIIHTIWDIEKYPNGTENAHQTDIAMQHCTGDWLFYVQADEVVHEQYLPHIQEQCSKYLDDKNVEGFLFHYTHFFGDYQHYNNFHSWYPFEIRIVRNHPDIHSWKSAQSFRRIPNFDGKNYRQKEGTFKLKVIQLETHIYHYGWVRPPLYMQKKSKALDTIHKGKKVADKVYQEKAAVFDYGNMSWYPTFKGTHPKVMKDYIKKMDWADQLNFDPNYRPTRPLMKHEQWKNRFLTFVEQKILGGKSIFITENWELLKHK